MRYTLLLAMLIVGVVTATARPPQEVPKRKIPCKTPENASMCYWTRGRLSTYEGWPPWRMWKVGTKRILAIYSGPSTWKAPEARVKDAENPELPTNVLTAYPQPAKSAVPPVIFADFEICPLDEEHPGVMQHACIESARNIAVQKTE
jgi:hypothetical protein